MMSARFQGTDELADAFKRLAQPTRKAAIVRVLEEAAEPMRQRMASMAPRGDVAPHIADNIVISGVRKLDGVVMSESEAAVAIGPGKRFFYGLFWEFGWKFHPTPHPFVRPAYDEGKAAALKAIGAGLWAEIRAAV